MKSLIFILFLFIQCIFTTAQILPANADKICAAREVFLPAQTDFNSNFTGLILMPHIFLNPSLIDYFMTGANSFVASASYEKIMVSPGTFNSNKLVGLPESPDTQLQGVFPVNNKSHLTVVQMEGFTSVSLMNSIT
ncbi:MAG: hypothetical protein WCK34_09735 [Bacteroidota bacterium]